MRKKRVKKSVPASDGLYYYLLGDDEQRITYGGLSTDFYICVSKDFPYLLVFPRDGNPTDTKSH